MKMKNGMKFGIRRTLGAVAVAGVLVGSFIMFDKSFEEKFNKLEGEVKHNVNKMFSDYSFNVLEEIKHVEDTEHGKMITFYDGTGYFLDK